MAPADAVLLRYPKRNKFLSSPLLCKRIACQESLGIHLEVPDILLPDVGDQRVDVDTIHHAGTGKNCDISLSL